MRTLWDRLRVRLVGDGAGGGGTVAGLPGWAALMLLSAALFLVGAGSFALSGVGDLAPAGVFGALAALAVLAAFWRR